VVVTVYADDAHETLGMKQVAWLTEYGITGGVLLLNALVFITLLNLEAATSNSIFSHNVFSLWQGWATQFKAFTSPFTDDELVLTVVSTLVAALSVILIFCTGLFLDLTAPIFFIFYEMGVFKRTLVSRAWFAELMRAHPGLIEEDFRRFVECPEHTWRTSHQWWAQRARYARIHSFVFTYLFFNAQGASLDQLQEQLRLWRTSRTVSTSMIFLAIGMVFAGQLTSFGQRSGNVEYALVTLGIPALLIILSTSITIFIYKSLCMTLCSLL